MAVCASQYHQLKITLPNFNSYNYRIQFNVTIGVIDSPDDNENDHLEFIDDTNTFFTKKYGELKLQDATQTQKTCSSPKYTDAVYNDTFNLDKTINSPTLFLIFKSYTNQECDPLSLLNDEAFTFSDLKASYIRCHPLCSVCTNSANYSCLSCIENAHKTASLECKCNDGYYFTLDKYPSSNTALPGKCLQCNQSCKKCTGPSFQECSGCNDGYTLVGTVCQFNCQEGQFWDPTQQICNQCHSCCRTCTSSGIKFCHDCLPDYRLDLSNRLCFQTQYQSQCSSCSIVINTYCGGTATAHKDCIYNGWIQLNSNLCVDCSNLINSKCGGDQSQEVINACQLAGFVSYNSNKCLGCQDAFGSDCGRSEVSSLCYTNQWIKYNTASCKNCMPGSPSYSECVCDSTCLTCSRFFTPTACTSCPPTSVFFNNLCLPKCPNGYTPDSNKICVECTESQLPTCFNCFPTCQKCEPLQVSTNNNLCTSCFSTRQLDAGQCKCRDNEDLREIYFECSYNEVAVIEPYLSESLPQLNINFGKKLYPPLGYLEGEISSTLCVVLFNSQTLKLFGTTYSCQIIEKQVNVNIDKCDSDLVDGNFIYINQNVLSYDKTQNIPITKFYNNIVKQKLYGEGRVVYNQLSNLNSCDDISITIEKFINDAGRGFLSFTWSIISFLPDPMVSQYSLLQDQISLFNMKKQSEILIPKGIIIPGFTVKIQIVYKLKSQIYLEQTLPLTLQVFVEKRISINIQTPIIFPLFRNKYGIISIQPQVIQCNPNGDAMTIEPIDFLITSSQYPDFYYQNSTFQEKEYLINIFPYTIPSVSINIDIEATLVSNSFILTKKTYVLEVKPSLLSAKIVGGNGYFSYKKKVTINGQYRDYDLPTGTEPQGIDVVWSCTDPSSNNACVDKSGAEINFSGFKDSVTFQQSTFLPYTSIKLQIKGTKDSRVGVDSVIILFSELDLPPLGYTMTTLDSQEKTVNLDEVIQVNLNYNSKINVDLLSFSGTIVYDDEVVGIIKFDYFSLKFQIWNYFSAFHRDNNQFSIRFNIFNPYYYMPSMALVPMTLNFPPNNCIFSMIQSTTVGYSLETIYVLQMNECEDENTPINYQFFFYKTEADFEYEKQYTTQVKRRQITDKQSNNIIQVSLPQGKLLLMAQAIDSKQAIYNTTLAIEVLSKTYDEASYLNIIQQKIDQLPNISLTASIFELSMLAEDIVLRTEFKSSMSINLKKIEIQDLLTNLSKQLSPLSTFGTLADKALSSLVESGLSFSSSQSVSLLNGMSTQLDEFSTFDQANLVLSKEKLKQKLYDQFTVIDSLGNSQITSSTLINDKNQQEQIKDLQDKIGDYLFKNMLPNEDPIIFKGASTKVLSNQVTSKNICAYFICENSDVRRRFLEESSSSNNIFNIKMLTNNENLYSNDLSFKNYTTHLKKADANIAIEQYPIITPSIKTDNNLEIPSFTNNIALQYKAKTENANKMSCLQRSSSGWTQDGCKLLYKSDLKKYTCVCQKLSPTTVINDLGSLFTDSNLGVAFGSEGLSNLSNFTNFYEYVAFWLLVFFTGGFVFLYFKGKALDMIDSGKLNIVSQQTEIKSSENRSSINLIYPKNKVVPFYNIQEKKDIESQKVKSEKTSGFQSINLQDESKQESPIIKEQLDTKEVQIEGSLSRQNPISLSYDDNLFKNKSEQIKMNEGEQKTDQLAQEVQEDDKEIKQQQQQVNSTNNQDTKDEGDIEKYTEKYQKFKSLPWYKQLFTFHNFLCIFIIFNPDIPRCLRFLVFYVRTIHTLAISVIFDKNYNISQKIMLAIVNAVSLVIILKLLEKTFVLKSKLGIYFSRFLNLAILATYYYTILSIVSGDNSSDSNAFISTFIIVLFTDLIVIASISAFAQLQLAHFIIKNNKVEGIMKHISKAIELQLIMFQFK